jgi:hypothetical protein
MNTIDATPQVSHGDRVTLGCPRYPFVKALLRTNTQNIRARSTEETVADAEHDRFGDTGMNVCALRAGIHAASGRSVGASVRSDLRRDDAISVMLGH